MQLLSRPKKSTFRESEHATSIPVGFSSISKPQTQDERKKLLASLRGQTIRVPNLAAFLRHWPSRTNENIDRMRQDIRQWLEKTLPPGKALGRLRESDFGHFGATWWPCAPFDKLKIVTYLAVWLFTWDDDIDLSSGTMWNEFEVAQRYREQTIAYVRYSLGIDSVRPDVQDRIILNFEFIGAAVRECYTLAQRQMFLGEIVFFIEMSEQEQRLRLSGSIATVEEYWHYRLGSAAVAVCLALNEFSWDGMSLPIEFYSDKDVRALFRHTTTLVAAVNDLLSIQMEVNEQAIDSLIPILYFEFDDIQVAVNKVAAFIQDEVQNLDKAAESLSSKYHHADAAMRRQVHQFIDGCKHYVTGNVTWSLKTTRYGVSGKVNSLGEVVITL